MKVNRCILIISCSILFFSGCLSFRTFPGGMEPSSSVLKEQKYKVLGVGTGQASSFALLSLITVTPRADINRAINEAINKKRGDALIDVRWWVEYKVYILGTVKIIHVKGKVIKYLEEDENLK